MHEGGKFRILIVEDDVDLQATYAEILKVAGYEVRMTHDGGHAAAILRSEPFDAAILDIRLPIMNGLQVAAVARANAPNRKTPILVISGAIDEEATKRAQAFGIITVIQKPAGADEILGALGRVLVRKTKPAVDVRVVNAILVAARDVLAFYHGEAPVTGKPAVRKTSTVNRGGVTGIISLAGETFKGSLAILTDNAFITALGRRVFDGANVDFTPDLAADLTGELCNQVCGRLKANLLEIGLRSSLGLPEVIIGTDHVVYHKAQSPILCVPLTVAGTKCDIEFCLAEGKDFKIDETEGRASATGAILFE